jgi:hypothetical protein
MCHLTQPVKYKNKKENQMNHKDLKEAIRLATRQALKEIHLKEQANEETEAQKFCNDLKRTFKKHFPNSHCSCAVSQTYREHYNILISYSLGKGKEEYLNGIFHNDPLATKIMIHGIKEDGKMPQVILPKLLMGGRVDFHDRSGVKVWRNFKVPSPDSALQKFDAFFAKLKSTVKDNLDKMPKEPIAPSDKI